MSAAAPMRGRGAQGSRHRALRSLPPLLALLAPLAASATLPPAAPPLRADLSVEFSAGEGNRTRVQGTVAVPVDEAVLNSYGFYNLQLEGTVSVEGRIYDRFAYRFDVPAAEKAEAPLALSFERSLRPGAFRLEIRVRDVQSGRTALLERPLQVPRVSQQPAPSSIAAADSIALTMDATGVERVTNRCGGCAASRSHARRSHRAAAARLRGQAALRSDRSRRRRREGDLRARRPRSDGAHAPAVLGRARPG